MNLLNYFNVNPGIVILLMILVNGFIFGICICRLFKIKNVLTRVKWQYIMGAVVSFANGLQTILFQQWPNGVGLAFAVWVCYTLWSDGYQWKDGPPAAAVKEDQDESKAE